MKKISLKDQVVSREIAVKLQEKISPYLEMPDETYDGKGQIVGEGMFALVWESDGLFWELIKEEDRNLTFGKNCVIAPTLPELLAVLPEHIESDDATHKKSFVRVLLPDRICYETQTFGGEFVDLISIDIDDKTNLATALAKLVIWCVENGHLGGESENT